MSFDSTWQVESSEVYQESLTELLWLTNSTTTVFIAVGGDMTDATVTRTQLIDFFGRNPSFRGLSLVTEGAKTGEAAAILAGEVMTVNGWEGVRLYVICKVMGDDPFMVGFTGIVPDAFAPTDQPAMMAVYDSIRLNEPAAVECLPNGASPCHDVYFPCCEGTCIEVDLIEGGISVLVTITRCWDGKGHNPAECRGYGDLCSSRDQRCSGFCLTDTSGLGMNTCG